MSRSDRYCGSCPVVRAAMITGVPCTCRLGMFTVPCETASGPTFADAIVAWHDCLRGGKASTINHRQIAREKFEVRDRYGAVLRLYRQLLRARQPEGTDETEPDLPPDAHWHPAGEGNPPTSIGRV